MINREDLYQEASQYLNIPDDLQAKCHDYLINEKAPNNNKKDFKITMASVYQPYEVDCEEDHGP